MKQYISDIIPLEDIQVKWTPGSRILITAPTGSGKSEFIKQVLYDHCSTTFQKVLILSNRILLREQIKEDLRHNENDIVTVLNYQYLESRILSGGALADLFSQYDYIVYDEAHYIFSDSQFNRNTDLLIQPIKTTPKDKIFIFLTATPQALYDYQAEYDFVYTIESDYSYIENLYFYSNNEIPESILQNIPMSEKAIYFSSSAKDSLELSRRFIDSDFFCSESNTLSDLSNKDVLDQITKNSKFYNRFLFTTKVLDNGINIKDDNLKHVIIDMVDTITLIQCLGRKRILSSNDKIQLYIKSYHDGNLKFLLKGFEDKISLVQERLSLTEEEFKEKYRKMDFDDVIDNDFSINEAKYQNYKTQARILRQILFEQNEREKNNFNHKNSYENYICKILNIDPEQTRDGNKEFEKITMQSLIDQYLNKKMFKEDQERFKYLFFDKIFAPKNTNYRHRGIRCINSILQEDSIPYFILSNQEKTRGENRDKTYWYITFLGEK